MRRYPRRGNRVKGAGPVRRGGKALTGFRQPNPREASTQRADRRGEKRSREPAVSGYTPPLKRNAKREHSYATVAAEATELVIRNAEGKHITKDKLRELEQVLNDDYLDQILKGEEVQIPLVEKWDHTATVATVKCIGQYTEDAIRAAAPKVSVKIMSRSSWEAQKRPTKFITGLVTGATANQPKEKLVKLLEVQAKLEKIPGKIELIQTFKTQRPDSIIIKLLVDDIAEARLVEMGNTLRFGFSDKILFEDVKPKTTTKVNVPSVPEKAAAASRVSQLESEIDFHRARLTQKMKDKEEAELLAGSETGSVSGRLTRLEIEEMEEELANDSDKEAQASEKCKQN